MEELCEKVPEAGEFALRCKFLHPPPAAETNASKDPPSKKRKLDPKRTGVGGQDAHLAVLPGCEQEGTKAEDSCDGDSIEEDESCSDCGGTRPNCCSGSIGRGCQVSVV